METPEPHFTEYKMILVNGNTWATFPQPEGLRITPEVSSHFRRISTVPSGKTECRWAENGVRVQQRTVHGAGEAGRGGGRSRGRTGLIPPSAFAKHGCLDEGVMPSSVSFWGHETLILKLFWDRTVCLKLSMRGNHRVSSILSWVITRQVVTSGIDIDNY